MLALREAQGYIQFSWESLHLIMAKQLIAIELARLEIGQSSETKDKEKQIDIEVAKRKLIGIK